MGKGKGIVDYFKDYPKCVFAILGNEFCERFSFYGMKAILVIYLNRALNYDESTSTTIYHAFNMVCYFMPIFGAMLADGYIGKYKTILILSIVYALGNGVMAFGAIPQNDNYINWVTFIGLGLIAVGTGGIKPCVSAFGADQFGKGLEKQKETFFSMFYMAINLGSLTSMFLTPILRSQVYCFDDNCYSLAFGVPAMLMVVAVIFFIAGTKYYHRSPPGENIIGKLFGCIFTALKGKCKSHKGEEPKDHWLDYADHKYDKDFIKDVREVLKVLLMFVPLPVFWALFDQQGSRWTLQAGTMKTDFGSFNFPLDMVQVMNPLLVVLLVPIFESAIFPCLTKLKIPNSPLQRLGFGMFMAGAAFFMTMGLQIEINKTNPSAPPAGQSQLSIINAAPCDQALVEYLDLDIQEIPFGSKLEPFEIDSNVEFNMTVSLQGCPNDVDVITYAFSDTDFKSTLAYNLIISTAADGNVDLQMYDQIRSNRTDAGKSTAMFVNALPYNISVEMQARKSETDPREFELESMGESNLQAQATDTFDISTNTSSDTFAKIGEFRSVAGAWYTFTIQLDKDKKVTLKQHELVTPNSLNIFLQLPQYFVMSIGEVFFSVTGLSFAYSQAPVSMKAVLQAGWLLTVAFGNLIVVIISGAQMNDQVGEFALFGGLMYLTLIIFVIMAKYYTYVEDILDESSIDDEEKPPGGLDNEGFQMSPEAIQKQQESLEDHPVNPPPYSPQDPYDDNTRL